MIQQAAEADRRVGCAATAPGTLGREDLRELRRATIVRVPTSPAVVDAFVAQGLEVAAGVKQQLEADATRHRGLRLIDEPFMVIRQAMGVAKARGDAAAQYLRAFVDELRGAGFVREALARHGIKGATPG